MWYTLAQRELNNIAIELMVCEMKIVKIACLMSRRVRMLTQTRGRIIPATK